MLILFGPIGNLICQIYIFAIIPLSIIVCNDNMIRPAWHTASASAQPHQFERRISQKIARQMCISSNISIQHTHMFILLMYSQQLRCILSYNALTLKIPPGLISSVLLEVFPSVPNQSDPTILNFQKSQATCSKDREGRNTRKGASGLVLNEMLTLCQLVLIRVLSVNAHHTNNGSGPAAGLNIYTFTIFIS